jgi:hypothetical protein
MQRRPMLALSFTLLGIKQLRVWLHLAARAQKSPLP